MRLIRPGELAKHAVSEGAKAVTASLPPPKCPLWKIFANNDKIPNAPHGATQTNGDY